MVEGRDRSGEPNGSHQPIIGVEEPQDGSFMAEALTVAREAELAGDIPVGAVVVFEGRVIARSGNARMITGDPTAHAEIIALRRAAEIIGHWRLIGCTLYVTLEPCLMCAGAIILSRLDRVVYGTADPKAGAVVSLYRVLEDSRLNHNPAFCGGPGAEESAKLLTDFFRAKRGANKKK